MEVYNPTSNDVKLYRRLILQHGSGLDSDGYYYYNQDGEGIGSFFGSLFKSALPVIGRSLKGAARIAAPHFKKAAKEVVTAGSKHITDKLSGSIVESLDKPKNPRKRRRKQL